MQLLDVLRAVVCQWIALEVRPSVFVGIEFRGVSRKVLQVQSATTSQPLSQEAAAVSRQPIPHNNDRSIQMPKQVTQEVEDLLLSNGAVQVEVKVPSQSPTSRRDGQASDGRDMPMVSRTLTHDRRFSANRPSPPDQRSQQEACFINENQMGPLSRRQTLDPRPIFLDPSGDRLLVAFSSLTFWPLRGKNRGPTSGAEWRRRGTAPRTACRSTGRSVGKSTSRWRTRRPLPLSAHRPPAHGVVERSACRVVLAPAGPTARPSRSARTGSATGKRSAVWCSAGGLSGPDRSFCSSMQPPCGAVAPVASDFRMVSCIIRSAISEP